MTHSNSPRGRRTERYDVVVVGGGQAGLAAGYWLAKQDLDFLIVDAHPRIGDVWRNRWTSLQLFTPARYSGLPGLAFPGDPYHLPGREQVADYLEWYATVFDLPVRTGTRVETLLRSSTGFVLDAGDRVLQADNVIVATGPFQTPRIPGFARDIAADVMQLHSSQYRAPAQLPAGDVLVVGAANSGAQIALELAKSRRVTLAGRSVGSLPRRILGRDVFDWLTRTVMRPGSDSLLGKKMRRNILSSSDALIGMTERDLVRGGVIRTGRVKAVRDGIPVLEDGHSVKPSAIVWSTGFRPDFSWVGAPVIGNDGHPVHQRGGTDVAGLYFLGLRFLHRLNSSLIGGVGADAQYVVEMISRRYGETRTSQGMFGFPLSQSPNQPSTR
jgi:putative flavoprotein involved in K+ transport